MFKANDRLNYSSLPLTKLGTLPDFGFAKSRSCISRLWLVRGLVDVTTNTWVFLNSRTLHLLWILLRWHG